MKTIPNNYSSVRGRRFPGLASERRSSTRGVALVITLILLLLLSAASVAIVLLVSSDSMINGFYRNYRGSFYSADSGINVVVESMKNSVLTAGVDSNNPPLPVGGTTIPTVSQVWANVGGGTLPTGLTTSYTTYQGGYYTMGDAGSWKGQFKMLAANPDGKPILGTPQFELQPAPHDSASCLPVTLANCPPSAANPSGIANDYNYTWTFSYPYEVTVQGQSAGTEGELITETGSIVYSSTSGTAGAGPPPAFSRWAAFITRFSQCQGPLVPGTMNGPFFTDGQWNFGNFSNPGYTFTGSIQQAGANASWWNNNTCTNSATVPNGIKKPVFPAGGLQLGVKGIVPPSDTYNQAQAVLDAKGIPPCTVAPCASDPPPTQAQMNGELRTIGGTAYAASGTPANGVYIPYFTSGTSADGLHSCTPTQPCYGGNPANGGNGYAGGFYVQGNASVTMIASTGGDGTSNLTQTYKITLGGTTTTIVVDNTAGTTTVSAGGPPVTLYGAPTQLNPNISTPTPMPEWDPSGNAVNPTLVYVNGAITGLTGTYGSGNSIIPAIQNNTGITVAASGSISITGDLTYASLPVTVPADVSVSNANSGVLGIYTNANINLYPDPKGNLTVDGSLAALSGNTTSGTSGFETPGGSITNWTIMGGRAEDQAHGVNISAGNTYYDTRFAGNFGPPWFPTAVPQAGATAIPPSQQVTVTRSAWAEVGRP